MITSDDQPLSLCVEICVEEPTWIEDLPPVPASHHITVSFESARHVARDQRSVEQLGYVPVGVAAIERGASGGQRDVAHLLIPLDVVRDHPRWWRALLDLAQRVYDLRFGPVQMALRPVLARHHAGPGNGEVGPGPAIPARPHPIV